MKFSESKTRIEWIRSLDVHDILNCNDAQLLYIEGLEKLKTYATPQPCTYDLMMTHIKITLNDLPIFYAHSSECPTCASLVAAGHGIENAHCEELQAISNSVNRNFINLKQSIKDINPLLTLLQSGLYVIADMLCYPTDGQRNFFWNMPNEYTKNPATAPVYLNDPDFRYAMVDGSPLYLFPTQSSDCYHESRVNEYVKMFQSTSQRPRAIAYHYNEYLNFLLDGHHKACAATCMRDPVNTLVIIPLTYSYTEITDDMPERTYYMFSNFKIVEDDIPMQYRTQKRPAQKAFIKKLEIHSVNNRIWENTYLYNAQFYPTLEDYAMVNSLNEYDIDDEVIQQWLTLKDKNCQKNLRSILALWKLQKNPHLKELALQCAHQKECHLLRVDAFRILCQLKNDTEIEDFFIASLAEDEDPHSLFSIIACSYWDEYNPSSS